jgi:hypothetical protein
MNPDSKNFKLSQLKMFSEGKILSKLLDIKDEFKNFCQLLALLRHKED